MRSYLILKALANTKDYIPITFFMEQLQVSKRTIQNEFVYLKKVADLNGYMIRVSYGKGYFLEVFNQDKFNHFLEQMTVGEAITNKEQLISEILSCLLSTSQNYVTTSQLADLLGISRSSLSTEMETVSNYLGSYSLQLERKSHYGVRIIGDSKDIRRLMLDLYLKGDKPFKEIVDQCAGNFDEYERLVEDYIRLNQIRIGYYEFQMLIGWLKVFVLFSKRRVTVSKLMHQTSGLIDYEINQEQLEQVLLCLQEQFEISVTTVDVAEFRAFIQSNFQKKGQIKNRRELKSFKQDLIAFFTEMDLRNHTDYSQDKEFLEQITTHLSFLLDRIDQKIIYKNPLLLELCIRYPLVFDIVLKFSSFLQVKFGYEISNDELGFIAVHFLNHTEKEKNKRINQYERIAVICTTGGGVSNLIRTQILGIFPNANVKAFSFWEEVDLKEFQPNLVFSVVPLKQAPNVPTIYIKELLSNRDIKNIRQVLCNQKIEQRKSAPIDVSHDYLELLKPTLFSVETAKNYDELIKKMALKMITQGYGDDGFQKNVDQRERYMSTVYNHGVAMPHPIEMKGRKSAIAVAVVKPELNVGTHKVRLVFMVCLAKDDFHYYSGISNGLFQLMQDESKISDIYNTSELQNIINILKEME